MREGNLNLNKKELMDSIFNSMSEREKNTLYQLGIKNIYFNQEIKKLENNAVKVLKAKGPLKQEKLKRKALKQLKESTKRIYETVPSSKKTYIFHILLDCISRLAYLLKIKSKIIGEDNIVFNENFNITFSDNILKKAKIIDSGISVFLRTMIKDNDMVINNKLLEKQINNSKKLIIFKDETKINYLIREYEFLKEIIQLSILGLTCMEEIEFKYKKNELEEYEYNFSRIKEFVLEIEKELKNLDLVFNCGKYKELILRSFLNSGENMTYESIDSYLEYLVWLDKKGRLDEEYQLIS